MFNLVGTKTTSFGIDLMGPVDHNIIDLGTDLVRWKDLFLAGKIDSAGGRITGTSRYTTTQTLDAEDNVVFCDTDGGAFTIDLPIGVEGTHYKIINCGSGGNDLTVDADTTGSSTVYGATTAELSDGEVINIHYNATEGWW